MNMFKVKAIQFLIIAFTMTYIISPYTALAVTCPSYETINNVNKSNDTANIKELIVTESNKKDTDTEKKTLATESTTSDVEKVSNAKGTANASSEKNNASEETKSANNGDKSIKTTSSANNSTVTKTTSSTNSSTVSTSSISYYVDNATYTEDDLFCLACVIYQEAGGSSVNHKMMVGNVVLNRVAHRYYGNTIRQVITAKNQYGRLYWTGVVFPKRSKNSGEKSAVQSAYECAKRLLGGERVLPKNVVYQAQFKQGDGIYCKSGNTYFCYRNN